MAASVPLFFVQIIKNFIEIVLNFDKVSAQVNTIFKLMAPREWRVMILISNKKKSSFALIITL